MIEHLTDGGVEHAAVDEVTEAAIAVAVLCGCGMNKRKADCGLKGVKGGANVIKRSRVVEDGGAEGERAEISSKDFGIGVRHAEAVGGGFRMTDKTERKR